MQGRQILYDHSAEDNSGTEPSQPKRRLIGNLFQSGFLSRRKLMALLIIIVLASATLGYVAYVRMRSTGPTSVDGIQVESGYTALAGNRTVSDGRISITVNNYHFEEAENIDFVPSLALVPTAVFILVNVTVVNVGPGNTSIGPSWVFMQNGSSIIGNTNFVYNASFPVGVYPNQTYPENVGGIYLPPGKETTFWYLFYVPYSESLGLSGVEPTITLKALVYYEQFYGGNYEGDGGYSGSSQDLKVQFIVLY